jgi:hypothetical protein
MSDFLFSSKKKKKKKRKKKIPGERISTLDEYQKCQMQHA